MKTITVTFRGKDRVVVAVGLATVPTITGDKATTPQYGRWACASPYIGKKSLGLYYIKRVPAPDCVSDEQLWTGMCTLPNNPYAFFFDTADEKEARYGRPFMLWDHFFLDIGSNSSGEGKLEREFVTGSGFQLDWKQIT
jgi:hypothetical protein